MMTYNSTRAPSMNQVSASGAPPNHARESLLNCKVCISILFQDVKRISSGKGKETFIINTNQIIKGWLARRLVTKNSMVMHATKSKLWLSG